MMTGALARAFPEQVWRHPALRGLDARAKDEIEAAGSLAEVRAGQVVYRPGDPADALCVVVRGSVSIRDGDLEIRRASAGESFGEEAIVRLAGLRRTTATCIDRATIATIPAVILRRAAERAGRDEVAERRRRAIRRAALRDAMSMLPLARALSRHERDVLLDAARSIEAPRGTIVMRAGDDADDVFVVLDGMLQLQEEDHRAIAYLVRGDVFGDEDAIHYACTAVTVGASWVIALPRPVFSRIAAQNPEAAKLARRIRHGNGTKTAIGDLYRLDVARSLLVIDQEACVRCGHCAASCASAHEDGVARIVRRGDKIRLRVVGSPQAVRSLLLPNSCQHCRNPACLVDCPTGAIGRTGRGEVVIREKLCTGCGNCARACPWDNIQLARRKERLVAVKCDLCGDREEGPACVRACPVQAIARVDPAQALEVRGLLPHEEQPGLGTTPLGPRTVVWPWVLGALLAGAGAATLRDRMVTGIGAGLAFVVLALYGAIKRLVAARLRPHFVVHLAAGIVSMGLVVAHAGTRVPDTSAGALLVAFTVAAVTGVAGAALYAIVPARLAKIERRALLPEDLVTEEQRHDVFRTLSGSSELTKKLYATVLRPYERATFGGARMLAFGQGIAGEEAKLLSRVKAVLGDRATDDRMRPIRSVVEAIVAKRAARGQRIAHALLRGWLFIHLASMGMAAVLLVVHLWVVWRYR
jgi:Fe-S-cluster-containing dehydrogenase component